MHYTRKDVRNQVLFLFKIWLLNGRKNDILKHDKDRNIQTFIGDEAGTSPMCSHACGKGRYMKELVMCVSNAYTQQYYLDKKFDKLPKDVKDELKIMSVLYTEEVGGIFTMMFDEDGSLQLISSCDEGDLLYDDIGSELLIKKMRNSRQELFESLEKYYKVFVLGKPLESDLTDSSLRSE